MNEKLDPIYPGEFLYEEFLKPLDMAISTLSSRTGIDVETLVDITFNKGKITPDVDFRLCNYFALSQGYWLRLQENLSKN